MNSWLWGFEWFFHNRVSASQALVREDELRFRGKYAAKLIENYSKIPCFPFSEMGAKFWGPWAENSAAVAADRFISRVIVYWA